jgi:acyl carrier protein
MESVETVNPKDARNTTAKRVPEVKTMAISRDEVFQKVQEVLVDALGVDDDEVKAEATLMGDLGAESIDFLDIVFRLEKAFDIKIPREELFPAENLMNDPEFVNNGKLTETGLAQLKNQQVRRPVHCRCDCQLCRRQVERCLML